MVGPVGPGGGVTLSLSLLDEPLTRPVLDGTTLPPGMDIAVHVASSVDANSRAMQALAFDVAEMSFATFLRVRLAEGAPLVALPAFTGRRFVQPLIGVRPDWPGRSVEDLRGRRVAVPQYWMTSSVWHRAVLEDHYGLKPSDVSWITTAEERFDLFPGDVAVQRCADGRTPADLVRDGEADAVLAPRPPAQGLRPLFADPVAEQQRYHRSTGVLPIMHLVVVREQVLEERPDEIAAIWRGLRAAREVARPGPPVPGVPESAADRTFGSDPWAHGIEPNLASLSALFMAVHRDGLVSRLPRPGEVFAPANVLSCDRDIPPTKEEASA